MSEDSLKLDKDGPVARLTLTRGARHNAFDDGLIAALDRTLAEVEADESLRVLVLAGEGRSFSAGADLNWMRRTADYGHAENLADAKALAEMLHKLNRLSKPTVARVQGAAIGGGVGLVACCDVVIAAERAAFALAEVRLGILPAAIAPYVVNAIGPRQARRYFQTAERFDAARAREIGLVHELVADEAALDAAVEGVVGEILKNSPAAVAEAKRLVELVTSQPLGAAVIAETAQRIADIRATDEGREGLSAFLEKRSPAWSPK